MSLLATLNPLKTFETAREAQQGVAATRAACALLALLFGVLSLARVLEHGLAWRLLPFGLGMFLVTLLLWAAARRRLTEGVAAIAIGVAATITAGGVASLSVRPSAVALLPIIALLWAVHGYRAVRALVRLDAPSVD